MGHLVVENMPTVLRRLFPDLPDGLLLLRTPVVATIVKRVVDDDADHIDAMGRIADSESLERVVEQWEPDGSEVLRSDRNENVAGA